MFAPTLGLFYRLTVRDANGRIVSRTRLRKAHSYLRQFTDMLMSLASGTDISSTDIGSVSRTLDARAALNAWHISYVSTSGDAGVGPVVGTGSTAVTISNTALGTLIAHGTGSGQLEYAAGSFGSVVVAGSTASFTAARVLTNSSGASITVNEIGIYAGFNDTGGTVRYFCIVRDVVAGGQAVGNTNTLTVEYVVKATV